MGGDVTTIFNICTDVSVPCIIFVIYLYIYIYIYTYTICTHIIYIRIYTFPYVYVIYIVSLYIILFLYNFPDLRIPDAAKESLVNVLTFVSVIAKTCLFYALIKYDEKDTAIRMTA